MRSAVRLVLFAAVAASAVGCRFKGYEAFSASTTPRPELYDYSNGKTNTLHSTYGNGGIADASGGLNPQTRYGLGANPNGTLDPKLAAGGYDQPQKGSGQQEGEYPNVAKGGHAQSNAPAFQPSPSDVGGSR